MIYTILIKCVDGIYLQQPFERAVQIDAKTNLNKLHNYIQTITDFDNDHCYDFFVGKTPRDSRNCLGGNDDFDTHPAKKLQQITLAQLFPLPKGQKLYYWFDFGDDWKFEITLEGTAEKAAGVKYPRVIAEKGPKPEQYPNPEE